MKIRGGLIWFCKLAGLIVSFSLIGYLLIVISYTLPRSHIHNHISESAKHYSDNTDWAHGIKATRDDVFTDSIMLHAAGFVSQNHFYSAAHVPRDAYVNVAPQDCLNIVYGDLTTDSEPEERLYARYWHGYLVFLVPLLEVFNPAEITYLNFGVQFCLIITLLFIAYRRRGFKLMAALAVFIFALNPISTALSYQYSTVFYPTVLSMIAILLFDEKLREKGRYYLFFAFIGCVVNYLDLLTYPLVSLGAPLALKLYLDNKRYSDVKAFIRGSFCQLIKYSFCWLLGYAGTWVLKWTIASIVTGQNAYSMAFDKIAERTGGDVGGAYSSITSIRKNMSTLLNFPTATIFGILVVIYLALLWRRKIQIKKPNISSYIFAIIAAFPFVWYAVLANHSDIHAWFTYRELAIAVFAVALFVISITEHKKTKVRVINKNTSTKKRKKL